MGLQGARGLLTANHSFLPAFPQFWHKCWVPRQDRSPPRDILTSDPVLSSFLLLMFLFLYFQSSSFFFYARRFTHLFFTSQSKALQKHWDTNNGWSMLFLGWGLRWTSFWVWGERVRQGGDTAGHLFSTTGWGIKGRFPSQYSPCQALKGVWHAFAREVLRCAGALLVS